MVRKKDLLTLCKMHPDCEFLAFTNGTLIDDEFCREMLRGFFGCRHFSKANAFLTEHGLEPIDWQIENRQGN